jgi:catechol 2,3-dioxygenase-like lactoylglutathione lyase family enzyme
VFDHVTIRVSDREASEFFYDTVLATLGVEKTATTEEFPEWGDFSLAAASAERPITRRLHLGFGAPSREHVDEFWRTGTAAGYRDDGPPGHRPQYKEDYYGSFLLDPEGNSAEAVHHAAVRPDGVIDHLWIRVADVAAATRFYDTIAPHAGLEKKLDTRERSRFHGASGSFSLVAGEPTEQVHMAFGVTRDGSVGDFHAAAVAAGYADNGSPGERPEYHPGYYSAFVLDPDGNNIEVVNHTRAPG